MIPRSVPTESLDSKEERDRAEGARDPPVQAILDQQSPFVEVRILREIQDPEWVVLPPDTQERRI